MGQVTAVLGDWIGALTLTGSAIAFAKLHGIMGASALALPGEEARGSGAAAADVVGAGAKGGVAVTVDVRVRDAGTLWARDGDGVHAPGRPLPSSPSSGNMPTRPCMPCMHACMHTCASTWHARMCSPPPRPPPRHTHTHTHARTPLPRPTPSAPGPGKNLINAGLMAASVYAGYVFVTASAPVVVRRGGRGLRGGGVYRSVQVEVVGGVW